MQSKIGEKNNNTIHLAIDSINVDALESLFYNQISEQLIRMRNAAITYNESQSEMTFLIDNVQHKLDTVNVEPDGSCLFGACVHQMLRTKIDSTTQSNETKKLRANVVTHIKSNYLEFKRELEGVALDLWQNEVDFNLELACKRFLEN